MLRPKPFVVTVTMDPFGGFDFDRRLLPPMTFGKKASDTTVKQARYTHVAILESGPTNVYDTN